MSYQALYRKFRPDNFADVKGQEHIVTTLQNQIKADRVGHAYLFCGTRGTGKTTVAKILAKAVNCENPQDGNPCGNCRMCRAITAGASMNVIEIDAASNNGVDNIREIVDEVSFSPAEGKYKVYIIDEVHMLSIGAFNALLKTLEEPPSYVIFILATTEAHKIPITILSRCQRYDFKRISVQTIADRLKELLDKEGIEAEEKALLYIAKLADGALRDGLSLLEQCISFYFGEKLTYEKVLKVLGAVDTEVYADFVKILANDDVAGMISMLDDVIAAGKDLTRFCDELIWYLRNLLMAKTTEHPEKIVDMSEENCRTLIEVSKLLETEMIFRYIRVLSDVENQMKYASQKRVLFEIALLKLGKPEMEKDYDSLVNRVHNLEHQLEKGVVVQASEAPAGTSKAVEKPAPKLRASAVPKEVKQLVGNWQQVLNQLDPVSKAMLDMVTLTVNDNGNLVIAFAKETGYSYFASQEANQKAVADAAAEVLDKTVAIEYKYVESQREYDALPELRGMFDGNDIVIETVE